MLSYLVYLKVTLYMYCDIFLKMLNSSTEKYYKDPPLYFRHGLLFLYSY